MPVPEGVIPVVDVEGAAAILGVSGDRVRQLADQGVLPVHLVSVVRPSGRRYRWFAREDVVALAEERRPKPPASPVEA